MEHKGLVCCRAGMGSSLMLKITAQKVVDENDLPIELEQSSLDALPSFDGDLVLTLEDVANELHQHEHKQTIIGISNIMDKNEILTKLNTFLSDH